jgi:hypothetical protein
MPVPLACFLATEPLMRSRNSAFAYQAQSSALAGSFIKGKFMSVLNVILGHLTKLMIMETVSSQMNKTYNVSG